MALLADADQVLLRTRFAALAQRVTLVLFTQELECPYCRETRAVLDELVPLSPQLELVVRNFALDAAEVARYAVDKIPAIVITGVRDYGIRFYGLPAGYEFTSLVEAIVLVGQGDSGLTPESRAKLARLTKPVSLQVFVTTTCPYCPAAVTLAHRCAVESELVRAAMIESVEFPHLAHRYDVMGVPKTILNDAIEIEGAVPEAQFIDQVVAAGT